MQFQIYTRLRHLGISHTPYAPSGGISTSSSMTQKTSCNIIASEFTRNNASAVVEHSNSSLVGAAATATAYGIKVLKKNDPYILNAEQASHGLTQAMFPGLFLVESIPMLKYVPEWMPGARFQRLAAKWRDSIRDMVDLPFEELKRDRMVCPGCPSLSRSLPTQVSRRTDGTRWNHLLRLDALTISEESKVVVWLKKNS